MSNGPEITPAILEAADAAKYLGVSLWTFYDYVAQQLIDVVHLPKRSHDRKKSEPADTPRRKQQFRKSDLDAFIERHVQPAKGATTVATKSVLLKSKNQLEPDWWKRASR